MRLALALLPFVAGCIHYTSVDAGADGAFYVLAERPPFARGFVLHCEHKEEGGKLVTRCTRVTDFKQARSLVPNSVDKPVAVEKVTIE